ncbi:hydroxymethylpyrimidine/phosphomethylpyrimidine kinase [Pedobacter sp. ASV1-7]|uniref:hydroxymethylpyrimidine/phosphomethylpyrimidine kinase n=1 Tax=Pedobacter sp. ASV1-7 TaxID=3145237 RepID=UPI0032E86594
MEFTKALRPYVMSIAGFDPSAGAGVLADIKCFEQQEVYGFGICSALTIQTDIDFFKNEWLNAPQIIEQTAPLLSRFKIAAVKIGLIKNISVLMEVISHLKKQQSDIKIVMDPVLKASAGYDFHDWENGLKQLLPVLKQIDLITPNYTEMLRLGGDNEVYTTAKIWSAHCPVLLKGGHSAKNIGTDYLYVDDQIHELHPGTTSIYQKHGSGCVLSAAITASLAKGKELLEACTSAKVSTEHFLNSNESLLGYHKL